MGKRLSSFSADDMDVWEDSGTAPGVGETEGRGGAVSGGGRGGEVRGKEKEFDRELGVGWYMLVVWAVGDSAADM
jgi:hypothetical protein